MAWGRLSSVFWRLYAPTAMISGLGALTLMCAAWLPFASALHLLMPRKSGSAVGRFAIHLGTRFYLGLLQRFCGCRFDLTELKSLKRQGPLIIAANHPSLLDALLLVSQLPNATCIMKATLMDNVLFGGAARLASYIRNESSIELLMRSGDELRQGAQLVIFPEGTRTIHSPVNPILSGTGMIAIRSGVPVQTVLIEFSSPYLGKAWPLFRPPSLPLSCRVRLGRRFDPPRDVTSFNREMEGYFRTAMDSATSTFASAETMGHSRPTA